MLVLPSEISVSQRKLKFIKMVAGKMSFGKMTNVKMKVGKMVSW